MEIKERLTPFFYLKMIKMSEIIEEVVTVIFRVWKSGKFRKEVDALFPYLPAVTRNKTITSYCIGSGHGSADYHYVLTKTRLATPDEYAKLKKHLEEVVEYKLKVAKKINYDKWLQSFRDHE